MIHNDPKALGASSFNFIKQVSSIQPTIQMYSSTYCSLVSLLILFWKDYSSCPMGIMYFNHIIVSLEVCNRLMGLSTHWEFKCFQEGTIPTDINTQTVKTQEIRAMLSIKRQKMPEKALENFQPLRHTHLAKQSLSLTLCG